METLLLVALFFTYRVVTVVLLQYGVRSIPYLGFFPYKAELDLYQLPSHISSLANFDGIHYLQIAKNGYQQYTEAFFPLFPLIIRCLGTIFRHNYLIAGLVIANLAFLAAIIMWRHYLSVLYGRSTVPNWATLFMLSYPTAFFLGTVYTESLFMFLIISSLLMLRRGNYAVASLLAGLSSFTRLAGVFLMIPFIIHILLNKRRIRLKEYIVMLSPLAGLVCYASYLWKTTGDPLMFYHAQPAFGANRSTDLILFPQVVFRYMKIFYTAAPNFQYFISVVEFIIFSAVLVVILFDLILLLRQKRDNSFSLDLGLIGFSLANLMVPPLTGTFSSIPRYSLLSLSFFIALSRRIHNRYLKGLLAGLFYALQLILFGYFMQGYFVS